MANYHLALNVVCIVSLVVLVRKLLERWFKPIAYLMSVCERDNGDSQGGKLQSILDRIRDWAFPKIPMV